MSHELDIDQELARYEVQSREWTQPIEFNLQERDHVDELHNRLLHGDIQVVDRIDAIAHELYEYENPEKQENPESRAKFVEEVKAEGVQFGKWFLFEWEDKLVRYADKDIHQALRTSRNRPLVRADEQKELYKPTIFVGGLSVGSHAVEDLVISGIGSTIITADSDTISPSNLNRIRAGFDTVGEAKIDVTAKKVSKIDPYIQQIHFRQGIHARDFDTLRGYAPDVLVDAVDDIGVKALMRRFAQHHKLPVLMATDVADKSILDVERHDLKATPAFNGRISAEIADALADGTLSEVEVKKLVPRLVGLRNVSARMLEGVMEIDKTIPGMPQLGVTASVGGGLVARATASIILERDLPSGRYYTTPAKELRLAPAATKLEAARTIVRFIKSQKS